MILETMSTNVSSLITLKLGGGNSCSSSSSSRSNMESIINVLLKSNSLSLNTLDLIDCKGVKCLTLGVSVEKLWVYNCPNLLSITLDQGSAGLISLSIRKCSSSLLDMVSAQSSTLENLKLGPFLEKLDEFPWPFSSIHSFPNLDRLELFGWEMVNSIALFEQIQLSTFPALTRLDINDFKGVKALPNSIAKLPSLNKLYISGCKSLESLPTFEESHGLLELHLHGCPPSLKERYKKESGPEWFKIQCIPHITWDKAKWQ